MIDIKVINGEFRIKGTFDMGYVGKFVNEDYSDGDIEIMDDVEDIYSWELIEDNKLVDASDDEIAKFLTTYFNEFEKKIQKNIKLVNDNFLINIFDGLCGCGSNFWKIDDITVASELPGSDNLENSIYKKEYVHEISLLSNEFNYTPNDGSVKKSDVEEAIRRLFPAFNLDKLLEGINTEGLVLGDKEISFQCSDSLDCKILCSAYDLLDEKLTFTDWHNF